MFCLESFQMIANGVSQFLSFALQLNTAGFTVSILKNRELHVTLTKHHNETHAMKMTNHNSKTAFPNVEIEEYENATAK